MPLVPSYIKKLKKYKPGKSIQEAELNNDGIKYIKLSSNENPHGSSPLAIKAIEKTYKNLNRYPDASGYQLRSKLAEKFNQSSFLYNENLDRVSQKFVAS